VSIRRRLVPGGYDSVRSMLFVADGAYASHVADVGMKLISGPSGRIIYADN
jgi:hypothetical protein